MLNVVGPVCCSPLERSAVTDVDPLCEEQIVLIEARDQTEALRVAEGIGAADAQEYLNPRGQLVRWKFERIIQIYDNPLRRIEVGHRVALKVPAEIGSRNPLETI